MRFLTILCLCSLIAGADAAEVLTLRCPVQPPEVRTYDLVERWRLDADDEDAPLIGVVSEVRALEPGGDLLLLDSQLSQVDKDKIRTGSRVVVNGVRQEIVFHLLETEPAIAWLRTLPDGTLAVYTCYHKRDLPAGVALRYDRHAPDGALLAEVRLGGEVDHDLDGQQVLPDGRAVILRNYRNVSRARFGMVDENDPVREDEGLQVIVCDLVER